MERLTAKGMINDVKTDNIPYLERYKKLSQLEDIEELCEKMTTQSIYEIYYGASEIHEEKYTECQALYNFKEKRIELVDCFEIVNWFNLDDYGKTWSLRKEELYEQKRNI